jgi:hypothetical protein
MQSQAQIQALSPLSLWVKPAAVEAPSSSVVAAVLTFGDVHEPREDGTVLIRFSAQRLEQVDMALVLGEACARAQDVSVVWDEREEQIVSVIDLAPLRAAAPAWRNKDRRRGFPSFDADGAFEAAAA